MRSRVLKSAVLAAGLAVAVASTAAVTSTARLAAAAPSLGASVMAAAGGDGATSLLLINGDRILVGQVGEARTAAIESVPRGALQGSLMTLRLGSREFLVPMAALPYLGNGLDPGLFNVAALARAEHGGRLPVTLRYQGGVPALPGVTVTRAAAGTAHGYLTTSSATIFGAALARQFRADHARGSYGTDGLFAGGLSVSLPGPGAALARTSGRPGGRGHAEPIPRFPMHVLTVTGTNLAGKPDTGDLVRVLNVTDPTKLDPIFGADNFFFHGTAKYSVPSGTYWAIGIFFTNTGFRLDVLPQFTVSGDTTVHMSERAADSEVSVVTPRPAIARGSALTIIRSTRHFADGESFGTAGSGIWVNRTTQPPTIGRLRVFTTFQLTPRGSRTPYGYFLNFAGSHGLIPSQRFTVRPADLAAVSERYYQDKKTVGAWLDFGGTLDQIENSFIGGFLLPVRLPGQMTQYLSARPTEFWQSFYDVHNTFSIGTTAGGQTDAFRRLHGGQLLTELWNQYPLHPGITVNVAAPTKQPFLQLVPSAVRAGDILFVDVTPFSDNFAGHLGSGFAADFPGKVNEASGRYALFQNGVKIAGGNAGATAGFGGPLFVRAKLRRGRSVIKLVLTASRADTRFPLSATSRDVWTWRSRREPAATVRPPWFCGAKFTRVKVILDRHCVVQGMLVADYHVARLALDGAAPAGQQRIVVDVTHLPAAAPSRIDQARLQVSFNDGKTWRLASIRRLAPGRFLASFTAAARRGVTLRLSAADRAGDTFIETIFRAYDTSA
jgi:hypothetical protein